MICYDTTEDIVEGTNECAKKEKNFLMKRNKCELKKCVLRQWDSCTLRCWKVNKLQKKQQQQHQPYTMIMFIKPSHNPI